MSDLRVGLTERLLPRLRCPRCKLGTLAIVDGPLEVRDATFAQAGEHLRCVACEARFPLTVDQIPVLWTDAMRAFIVGDDAQVSAVSANIKIYDAISDDYNQYTRRDHAVETRLRGAAARILAARPSAWHLDFGCGPGHVLGWLARAGLQQVGLDVSLVNLRNARRQTGAHVVCGDATAMPFADDTFDLVSESSVLHHIADWQLAVAEACRVCDPRGGAIFDSEPSRLQMAWGRLATRIYEGRFRVYRLLSYVDKRMYAFRDTRQARLNLMAELHHQPGTGLDVDAVASIIERAGFRAEIIQSPTAELQSKPQPNWQIVVLNLLSARNPLDPSYYPFSAFALPIGADRARPAGPSPA